MIRIQHLEVCWTPWTTCCALHGPTLFRLAAIREDTDAADPQTRWSLSALGWLSNPVVEAWKNKRSFASMDAIEFVDGAVWKWRRQRGKKTLLDFLLLKKKIKHRPWMFDEPELTTSIYRQFVGEEDFCWLFSFGLWIFVRCSDLHTSLAVYLLSTGSEAFEKGVSIVRPVAKEPPLDLYPSTYAYFLGPSVFVFPVLKANVSVQRVDFPKVFFSPK